MAPLQFVSSPTSPTSANDNNPEPVEEIELASPSSTATSAHHAAIPSMSTVLSRRSTATAATVGQPRYFHSRRITKGETPRPWLDKKDPREKWVTIIPLLGILVGLLLSGVLIYDGLQTVQQNSYCLIYEVDFSQGGILDPKVWTHEVQVGGFGNGVFDETTPGNENAFIDNGVLVIQPTLQNITLIEHNSILNLTKEGICTSNTWVDCIALTNVTNGTIINPVKSARINTKKGASIRFGRVEVVAKIPSGDWLWPAIWMLPMNNTYGPWPASGEIDIMESRGNNYTYPQGGNNIVSSTLHWGPDASNDEWWRNNIKREALHTTWSAGFHTYGLEWSEKYIFSYIDTRLLQGLYTKFDMPFWQRGHFPPSSPNGTRLVDPWSQTGRDSTPFDQDFYLIINLAVGGTNGWFQDGVQGKPWVDGSPTAMKEFWDAKSAWWPNWQMHDGGRFEIQSVKVWQQKGYNGC